MNFLIVLLGPTGVGKTDLSVGIAMHFGCDIISADSRQFYREMCIGTAVPSETQLSSVKHHFIQTIPVTSYYSSSRYERDVLDLLPDLFRHKNIVVMTGGSGMYIDAVCDGIDDIPDVEPEIRDYYCDKFKQEGIEPLRLELKIADPVHYAVVDLKNPKRIIRALEICKSTGRPYSSFLGKEKQGREFSVVKIGLNRPRTELYDRINNRVDQMITDGLEDEAKKLYIYKDINALNSVGYKEFFSFFDGAISHEKAIELIKRNSRRYAKRQLTWWSKDTDINWFHPDNKDDIIQLISSTISQI